LGFRWECRRTCWFTAASRLTGLSFLWGSA